MGVWSLRAVTLLNNYFPWKCNKGVEKALRNSVSLFKKCNPKVSNSHGQAAVRHPSVSQICSIRFKSGNHAGQIILCIISISSTFSTSRAVFGPALLWIKRKKSPMAWGLQSDLMSSYNIRSDYLVCIPLDHQRIFSGNIQVNTFIYAVAALIPSIHFVHCDLSCTNVGYFQCFFTSTPKCIRYHTTDCIGTRQWAALDSNESSAAMCRESAAMSQVLRCVKCRDESNLDIHEPNFWFHGALRSKEGTTMVHVHRKHLDKTYFEILGFLVTKRYCLCSWEALCDLFRWTVNSRYQSSASAEGDLTGPTSTTSCFLETIKKPWNDTLCYFEILRYTDFCFPRFQSPSNSLDSNK